MAQSVAGEGSPESRPTLSVVRATDPVAYGDYQWLRPGRRTLRLMDAGDDVQFVQGHVGAVVDGYFGPQTASALRAFLDERGRPGADPVVGPEVWALLLGGHAQAPRRRRRWRLGAGARAKGR